MDDRELEGALDELFAQPPEEFVGARNALVRRLKSAKRTEDAAMVAGWRRPTRTTWALNRLARTGPDAVSDLVTAAEALREEQAAGGPRVRDAMTVLRQATRAAADAAVAAIAPARPSDHADISAGLLAVLSDSDALASLARGRLIEVPEPGLGAFGSAPPDGSMARAPAPRKASAPKARRKPQAGEAEEAERRRAQEEALRRARQAKEEATAARDTAASAAAEADDAVEGALARVDRARTELADAEAAADAATDKAATAHEVAGAADQGLAEAQRALSELEEETTG